MGLRGPTPQPTELKRFRGNPGKRPLGKNEPNPGALRTRPPAHLDAEARKEWKRLSGILGRMKVLTEADYIALGNLCVAYSTLIQAQKKLSETGLVMKAPSGYITQSPLLSIVNTSTDIVLKHLREFGLTPAARTRVAALGEADKAEESSLLNGEWKPAAKYNQAVQ